ncbi:nucleotide-diphospho-sugar transferase [Mycena floridula]|nr:nucleotide-diphospho-sugar transferase [Mycena floridula]
MIKSAYVTLLTKESYAPGVMVLHHSLQKVGSAYPLVVMVTPALSSDARELLKKRGITMHEVETLKPQEGRHTLNAGDIRFEDTWTKLRVFGLEYERVVFLDADMLVMKNMDELMTLDLPHDKIAAAHVCACNPAKYSHYPADWIPENCAHTAVKSPTALPPVASESTPRPYSQLNSGTLVLNPSAELSAAIVHFLMTTDQLHKFSFPDQDLLTAFFKDKWIPLSWYYNALKTLRVVHPDEWSDDQVRCLHYILPEKPWKARVPPEGTQGKGHEYDELHRLWWAAFEEVGLDMAVSDEAGWKLCLENVASK